MNLMIFNRKKTLNTLKITLFNHIDTLTNKIGERNSFNYINLEKTYQYIFSSISKTSYKLIPEKYLYNEKLYYNLIAEKKGTDFPDEIIIIGAHYDTVQGSPGADDNSSGVAALIELIKLLDEYKNKHTIRFVAFTLEEPPFYNSPWMGSYIHAKSCRNNNENIINMISLEMLAYFSDNSNTQKYPSPDLEHLYGNKGNFILVVGNIKSQSIANSYCQAIEKQGLITAESLITYKYVPGTDLSDHSSFWNLGYNAIMITDTAFYRNPYYHQADDTIDKLNFDSFAKVVYSLYCATKIYDLE